MEIKDFLEAVQNVESGRANYWIAAEKFGEGELMVQSVTSEDKEFIMNLANDTEMDFIKKVDELESGKPRNTYTIHFF